MHWLSLPGWLAGIVDRQILIVCECVCVKESRPLLVYIVGDLFETISLWCRCCAQMEKYRLVEEHKGDGDEFEGEAASSEVRITHQGKPRNYISYAMNLFVSVCQLHSEN